jgi:hypothetical protein
MLERKIIANELRSVIDSAQINANSIVAEKLLFV